MNECQFYRLCYGGSPNCSAVIKAFFGKFLINTILQLKSMLTQNEEDYLKIHSGDFGCFETFCVGIFDFFPPLTISNDDR